jgi:hypothetical protein
LRNPFADAFASIVLFLALCFFVGLSMPHFFAGDDSLTDLPYQAAKGLEVQLPPLWQCNSPNQGRVRDLLAVGNTLLATGRSIGIYSLGTDDIWRPFNTGLGKDSDITAMAFAGRKLLIGSGSGNVYTLKNRGWRLINPSKSHTEIQWIFQSNREIFYADKINMGILGENGASRLIPLEDFTNSAISFLHRETTFSTATGRFSISVWRSRHGSASILMRNLEAAPSSSFFFARKAESYALLRAPVSENGISIGGAPALPEEMMSHNVRDIILYPSAKTDAQPRILAAIDGFGIVQLSVDKNGDAAVSQVWHQGLPIEPVTSLALFKGAVFAGTDGKGVYRKGVHEHRFKPVNSGLLYIP